MFFLTPALDLNLFLLVNQQWRNPLFDFIMPILSSMTALMILLGAFLILAAFKGGKRQVILFLVLLVGMGISDITTSMIKGQINRTRPLNAIAGTHHQAHGFWQQLPADFVQTKEGGTSYPSGHSANTMCLAVLATLLWPTLRKWPLILPFLVGYSRLYVGKHYPTDVLGGWLYGFIVAVSIWLIWEYVIKRHLLPER